MSELQTGNESTPTELITPEAVTTASETIESGPELATGGDENPDKINQESVNKAINKANGKRYEAERTTKTVQDENAELRAKLDLIEANKPAPTISAIPDREFMSDEEFNAALSKRDQEQMALANHNASIKHREDTKLQQSQDAENARNERLANTGREFEKRAITSGITKEQLSAAASQFRSIGIEPTVGEFILELEDGPFILQHLAANPDDHHALNRLSPIMASQMITGSLREKAAALKPKQSTAPAPLEPLSGNGVDPNGAKSPWLEGGTYN